MTLATYISNWSAACMAVTGINQFISDEQSTANENNLTYPFVLLLPPTKTFTGKGFRNNSFDTVLHIINSKGQKNASEVVTEHSRLEGLLKSALDKMLQKTGVINASGDIRFNYSDAVIGGNSLLSVRMSVNIVTSIC